MSLGKNLQYLRKMHNKMTQEELAEKMQVSRQTVSKWELDTAYPEINKLTELCEYFSCSMDEFVRTDMTACEDAYSNIRIETVEEFSYIRYAVISMEPEEDAIRHVNEWANSLGIPQPEVIGWDFPFASQEQINVFHMHGYAAALILPPDLTLTDETAQILTQKKQRYAAITIKFPSNAPFHIIPGAYKTLSTYMQVNGCKHCEEKDVLSCYEKEYTIDGIDYMDVYIAVS